MRSGILMGLIVIVVCACATAAERPVLFAPGDIIIASQGAPNIAAAGEDPNQAWDPAAHLVADWESVAVSMTSRLYNPALEPDETALGPEWSLSVTSVLDILDSTGLIGLSDTATSVKVFGPDGQLIGSDTPGSPISRYYRQPRAWSVPAGFPMTIKDRFNLAVPVDPSADYPDVLSKVEWTMNVLVADELKTVDIPFQTSETWVELTPGIEVLVEKAVVEEGKYDYSIKTKFDSSRIAYMMTGMIHLWQNEALPSTAVLKLDVLNAQGKSIRDSSNGAFGSSAGYGGSGSQMSGTASGHGSCDACGEATTIRYTLAFDMYEQEAGFVLENIPVPEF